MKSLLVNLLFTSLTMTSFTRPKTFVFVDVFHGVVYARHPQTVYTIVFLHLCVCVCVCVCPCMGCMTSNLSWGFGLMQPMHGLLSSHLQVCYEGVSVMISIPYTISISIPTFTFPPPSHPQIAIHDQPFPSLHEEEDKARPRP